jgi:AraC-like DNA-binding protein
VAKKTLLFRNFLEEDNLEKFSLEATAGKFGLNKYKFLRLFKNETGLTPNNYIILKRIEKSKILLQTQDDLLGVAIESGFYDATHFGKHFKKVTGVTPAAYRHAMLCNIVP